MLVVGFHQDVAILQQNIINYNNGSASIEACVRLWWEVSEPLYRRWYIGYNNWVTRVRFKTHTAQIVIK